MSFSKISATAAKLCSGLQHCN